MGWKDENLDSFTIRSDEIQSGIYDDEARVCSIIRHSSPLFLRHIPRSALGARRAYEKKFVTVLNPRRGSHFGLCEARRETRMLNLERGARRGDESRILCDPPTAKSPSWGKVAGILFWPPLSCQAKVSPR